MRIGIDAKRFYRGPISTRVILQNLLPCLFAQYLDHEWIIFLDIRDSKIPFPFKQKHVHVQYVHGRNTLLSNLFVIPFYIRKWRLDLVFFQTFIPLKKDIRSIAFIHDILFREYPEYFTRKERLYFKPIPVLIKNATRIMVTTRFVADELIKFGYTSNFKKIDIVPLGLSSKFKPIDQHDKILVTKLKKKFNLPDQYLLFVGRLNIRKNIENLLNAFPLLYDKNIHLVIVGEPDWKSPNLDQLISEKNIRERVILTGWVAEDELAIIYALSKVFCYPSLAEGFGLPPLEAMKSGVPVVISKIPAHTEVCGDAAIYADATDPKNIAEAITRLLENPELAEQKKKEGQAHAARFTWERTAEKFMVSVQNAFSY